MAMSVSDFVDSKKGDKTPEYITAIKDLLAFNDIESLNDLVRIRFLRYWFCLYSFLVRHGVTLRS